MKMYGFISDNQKSFLFLQIMLNNYHRLYIIQMALPVETLGSLRVSLSVTWSLFIAFATTLYVPNSVGPSCTLWLTWPQNRNIWILSYIIALQFAVSSCTWLNGQAPFRRFTLMYGPWWKDRIENCSAQLCPKQQQYRWFTICAAQLCPREQQYWWCAMPLSGLNCPLRGTKYLPSENPISKRAANPNWWRRWRGEVGLLGWRERGGIIPLVYQMQHISVGKHIPSRVAQRVHWCVYTWGSKVGFISQYAHKHNHKRFMRPKEKHKSPRLNVFWRS